MSDSGKGPPSLRVLYLPSPDPNFSSIPDDAVRLAFERSNRHELIFFDHTVELEPQFENVDVVIDMGGSVGTRRMLHAATSARLWQVLGYGLDHFDLKYWASHGMVTAHCPGPNSAVALAEFAMMQMLMLARRYPEARACADRQIWSSPFGMELEDRVLGLVGFGASARALTTRALAFDMRIMAIEKEAVSGADVERYRLEFIAGPERLHEMLPNVDFVSMHLPLNNETRHILDADALALLPTSAHVINVARGALVDEGALVTALLEGRLAGAGLDVFGEEPLPLSSPLYGLPNVILTPHVSGGTDGTFQRRAFTAVENCDRVARGEEPLHRVI
ncbi:MAG: NAD(P)-dependent oxidoreductase [Acidimicrobiia bacterium]